MITNYSELVTYSKELATKNKYLKDFRCCDYDVILDNQTNIKYPALWMEESPAVELIDDNSVSIFSFTLSVLYQEPSDKRTRLAKSQEALTELMEYVTRMRLESIDEGISVMGAKYECDFSLSNDKDMRWRVDLQVSISACDEVHDDMWNDL